MFSSDRDGEHRAGGPRNSAGDGEVGRWGSASIQHTDTHVQTQMWCETPSLHLTEDETSVFSLPSKSELKQRSVTQSNREGKASAQIQHEAALLPSLIALHICNNETWHRVPLSRQNVTAPLYLERRRQCRDGGWSSRPLTSHNSGHLRHIQTCVPVHAHGNTPWRPDL